MKKKRKKRKKRSKPTYDQVQLAKFMLSAGETIPEDVRDISKEVVLVALNEGLDV